MIPARVKFDMPLDNMTTSEGLLADVQFTETLQAGLAASLSADVAPYNIRITSITLFPIESRRLLLENESRRGSNATSNTPLGFLDRRRMEESSSTRRLATISFRFVIDYAIRLMASEVPASVVEAVKASAAPGATTFQPEALVAAFEAAGYPAPAGIQSLAVPEVVGEGEGIPFLPILFIICFGCGAIWGKWRQVRLARQRARTKKKTQEGDPMDLIIDDESTPSPGSQSTPSQDTDTQSDKTESLSSILKSKNVRGELVHDIFWTSENNDEDRIDGKLPRDSEDVEPTLDIFWGRESNEGGKFVGIQKLVLL